MNQQDNDTYNPFDPTGMFQQMRDANMDTWAKMMVDLVQTEAYAEATGKMLDTWLSSSGPFRNMIENNMRQALANLNLPSREDVTRLAERLIHIEMKLDDLEAKLDESLHSPRKNPSGGKTKSGAGSGK